MTSGFVEKLIQRLDRVDPGRAQEVMVGLLREKGFLEQVFESLREGVILLSPEGIVESVNRAACGFFGLDPARAAGQPLEALVRGLDWPRLRESAGLSMSRDLEVFYPENRFLNFYLAPIEEKSPGEESGAEKKNLGWVMLIRDTTRSREEAEKTLEHERLSALTLLAAGVAHEIGNPLNSLGIHLQLLARKLGKLPSGDRGELAEHLDTARREVERLDVLLKDFLQAVRPTTPRREPEDLDALIRETLRTLEPELAGHGTRVVLDLDGCLPPLLLDRGQIQQALHNLLRNARQAVPAGDGEIRVATAAGKFEVTARIEDNGSGISPEQMGTLFEPFQSSKENGTGLGLMIVQRITREHGGRLEVESTEGKGTAVTLSFPREDRKARLLEDKPTIEV